jgi:hypothetical protein
MTAFHSLRLFQIVSKYIPPDDGREIVLEVESIVRNQLHMDISNLATRSELLQTKNELRKEIHELRDELKGDIHNLREELKGEIHNLRVELKEDIHNLRDELKSENHQLRLELKGDISRLEVRMEAGFKDQLKWIIVLMLGFSSLIIGVVKFL